MNKLILAMCTILAVAAAAGCGSAPPASRTPTLAPTATPASTPAATATLAPTPTPNATLRAGDVEIGPGTYDAQFEGYRYTLTVPDTDFTDFGPGFAGWGSHRNTDYLAITWDGLGDVPNFAAMVIYGDIRTLYLEPCHWAGSAFTPGPTVDDLATALAALDGFESTQPTDVTVAGYHGKRMQMSSPADVNVGLCHGFEYRAFEGTFLGNEGVTIEVRILDLDGNRVMLATHVQVGTPAEAVAELNRMLDSLRIEPVNP